MSCFTSGASLSWPSTLPTAFKGHQSARQAPPAALGQGPLPPLALPPPSALPALPRRAALGLAASALLAALQPCPGLSAAAELPAVKIRPELAPDQSRYDASDPRLREAAQLLQQALAAGDVREEEALWTRIINEYGSLDADWVPDLVGRV
jgi:hypothetical protein